MELIQKDLVNFNNSKYCHICNGLLENWKGKPDKVMDHCHLTGKYRGAAHNSCNLRFKTPKFYPVVFHNLQNYDSHLFVKHLGKSEGRIKCIAANEEKYISFSKYIKVGKYIKKGNGEKKLIFREIRFIDSIKFMQVGLASLVNNLKPSQSNCMNFFFKGDKLKLLLRKGVFPYDYFNSFKKLSVSSLPQQKDFYSKLNDLDITDDEYNFAKKIWKEFRMKTLRDYHDLYLKTDVLLLSDVFENFRELCLENYKLDPAWYYTSPGLAWDACLKLTGIDLELISDPDILLMLEDGIRGGISSISTRFGQANNPYMKDWDSKKPTKYITYLDANNLYGWAMSKKLPIRNFKWMKEKDLERWHSIPCILKVDLRYPK